MQVPRRYGELIERPFVSLSHSHHDPVFDSNRPSYIHAGSSILVVHDHFSAISSHVRYSYDVTRWLYLVKTLLRSRVEKNG